MREVIVADVLEKIQGDRLNFEMFGIMPTATIKYNTLARALSDAILAQAGIERGKGRPRPDMVLGPVAKNYFEELKVWVEKHV